MINNNKLYLRLILIICLINIFDLSAQCENEINVDCTCAHEQPGTYYKGINGMFTTFEGEYVYSNNGIIFEIKLLKKLASMPPNNAFCEDMLIGGFRFENGSQNVNCITNINSNHTNGRVNNIYATYFYTGKTRGCDECGDNEKWLIGTIKDPVSGSVDKLFIRKIMHSGQEAIKIFIRHSLGFRLATDPIPPPITYPVNQDIILIKQ